MHQNKKTFYHINKYNEFSLYLPYNEFSKVILKVANDIILIA